MPEGLVLPDTEDEPLPEGVALVEVPVDAVPPGPTFDAFPKLLIVFTVDDDSPETGVEELPPGAPEVTVELFVLREASFPE